MSQSWESYSGSGTVAAEVGTKIIGKLDALRTRFSGDTEPASPVARMIWADTANKLLKERNAANTAWVVLGVLGAPNHRHSFLVHVGTVGASKNVFFFVAPHATTVEQASLLCSAGIAASDTDYWTVQVRNLTQSQDLLAAAKTTKVTGGDAIVADTPWDLDPDQNLAIAAGDVLEVQITKTGSPSDLVDLALIFLGYPTGA